MVLVLLVLPLDIDIDLKPSSERSITDVVIQNNNDNNKVNHQLYN